MKYMYIYIYYNKLKYKIYVNINIKNEKDILYFIYNQIYMK